MRIPLSLLLLPLWVVVSNAFQSIASSSPGNNRAAVLLNTAIVARTPSLRQSTALVHAAMKTNNVMTSDDEDDKDENCHDVLLYTGYRTTAVAYVLAGGWVALDPSGVDAASLYASISGPIMAATLSYILSGAASPTTKNRLASTTYKRLNLLLIQYGAIGLIHAALVVQPTELVVLSFVSMISAIEGYAYGVRGWNLEGEVALARKDLVHQVKTTIQSIFSIPSNLLSAEYWLCTVAVGSLACTLAVLVLVEMIQYLVARRAYPVTEIAPLLALFRRFVLLTGTSLTLQDAAERGRLQGKTFIQLNFLSAFVFGAMAGMWLFESLLLLL